MQKGIQKGRQEERESNIVAMLKEKIPMETISRITHYSLTRSRNWGNCMDCCRLENARAFSSGNGKGRRIFPAAFVAVSGQSAKGCQMLCICL